MSNFQLSVLLCFGTILFGTQASAQFSTTASDAPPIAKRSSSEPVKTMLLGVYHFNNPGLDEYNVKVDDYFSDRRQAEIAEVVKRLAKFKPNKIFVEASSEYQGLLDERYKKFVDGDLKLQELNNGRSETYQIGFRLAKACNLDGVVCIDAPGAWLGTQLKQTAAKRMPVLMGELQAKAQGRVKEEGADMAAKSVAENLMEHNTTASIMDNHAYYNQMAVLVADPDQPSGLVIEQKDHEGGQLMMIGVEGRNIGAELVGKWYTRNIKIFSNLVRSIEKDDERVLVIFGQGHIRPIKHFCEDHPVIELIDPNAYLGSE